MSEHTNLVEALRRAQFVLRTHNITDDLFAALCTAAGLPTELEQCNELIDIMENSTDN